MTIFYKVVRLFSFFHSKCFVIALTIYNERIAKEHVKLRYLDRVPVSAYVQKTGWKSSVYHFTLTAATINLTILSLLITVLISHISLLRKIALIKKSSSFSLESIKY